MQRTRAQVMRLRCRLIRMLQRNLASVTPPVPAAHQILQALTLRPLKNNLNQTRRTHLQSQIFSIAWIMLEPTMLIWKGATDGDMMYLQATCMRLITFHARAIDLPEHRSFSTHYDRRCVASESQYMYRCWAGTTFADTFRHVAIYIERR